MATTLQRIRLELARTPENPHGNREHGYEFVAPLNAEGHIDAELWKELKPRCVVQRFAGDQTDYGILRRAGQGWRFDYDSAATEDDEPFFKLDRHRLTPGSYVSITENDGTQRPFKVVSVSPVEP